MIPRYMEIFDRAVREIEARKGYEKSEIRGDPPGLNSLNSLNSQLRTPQRSHAKGREKSEKSEISPPDPYVGAFAALEGRCPDYVDQARWQQCVVDARQFLAQWGQRAHDLGWTTWDLFGLHSPPNQPRSNYSRLSRRDHTGLLWLLGGDRVIVLTEATAAMQSRGGVVTTYRKRTRGKQ